MSTTFTLPAGCAIIQGWVSAPNGGAGVIRIDEREHRGSHFVWDSNGVVIDKTRVSFQQPTTLSVAIKETAKQTA